MQEDMLNIQTVLPKYIAAQLGLQTLKSDTEQLSKKWVCEDQHWWNFCSSASPCLRMFAERSTKKNYGSFSNHEDYYSYMIKHVLTGLLDSY